MRYSFLFLEYNNCASNPCENGGTCRHVQDTYKCYCSQGFFGNNCELGNQANSTKVILDSLITILPMQNYIHTLISRCSFGKWKY